ncbi:MAG: cation-binding protein [Frankiales bacterium]|nr:cation-binding protein [Frankiales bacterium]
MADITTLILNDHTWFRQQFARLDVLQSRTPPPIEALGKVWGPLAARLDVHALAEEQIFYPQLLRKGENPEAETLDAIGDHNDIRDGVHAAAGHLIGTPEWWQAVGQARLANDEHMGEEEREGLSDFRQHAPIGLRESLGRQFAAYLGAHPRTTGLDTSDKDPQAYVEGVEAGFDPGAAPTDGSLGIGSLRGRPGR